MWWLMCVSVCAGEFFAIETFGSTGRAVVIEVRTACAWSGLSV